MTAAQRFDVTRAWRNMAGDWSFTKLLITAVFVAKYHELSALIIFGLIAAAFGKSTYESFLQRGTWTASDATINNTETRITLTGEPGVQPAP